MKNVFSFGSTWDWEQWRNGECIKKWSEKNIVPNEGIAYFLGSALASETPITSWYIAIFDNDYPPVAGCTYATPNYTENTDYDETTRPEWVYGSVTSQTISNLASKATFTMSAAADIYGAGLVGGGTAATTKDDTAGGGTLLCASQFSSGVVSLATDDILKVVVAVSGASF